MLDKMRKGQRWIGLFFVALLFLSMSLVTAYGAEPLYILKVDGKEIHTEVAPTNRGGRILVPARAFFEAIGGTVEWDGNTSVVSIDYQGHKVKLTINSKIALLDGQEKPLDVPAQIIKANEAASVGSTMVPVRFVTESFGYSVTYDDKTKTVNMVSPSSIAATEGKITDVSYNLDGNHHRITVNASEVINTHKEQTLSNPTRFVVDLSGFTLDCKDKTIMENDLISAVRSGQLDQDTVRVVADLKRGAQGKVSLSSDKKTLYIDFTATSQSVNENTNGNTNENTNGNVDTNQGNEIGSKKPDNKSEVLIVIDPGHGGNDPGSQGKENGVAVLNEKDVNFDVATRLNEKLTAAGIKTHMTRTGDTSVDPKSKNASEDLKPRAEIANNMNATIFVSIHNNSVDGIPAAKGTETLYFDTDIKLQSGFSSKDLATIVQKKMIANLGTSNRGIKERPGLAVLRLSNVPAIIVEGAFLSNDSDLQMMKTDEYREKYASAVADGIIEYLNQMYPQ